MTYPQQHTKKLPAPCTQTVQTPAKQSSLKNDRSLAKTGMAATLGALVMTGLMRTPQARALHFIAGTALVGLCIWHTTLYKPNNKK